MNFKKTINSLIVLLFVFCCHVNSSNLEIKKLSGKLQDKLNELTLNKDLPGATLAVVLPNKQIISLAAGLADKNKKIKMRPTDRMFSGSIGKTYLVPIILQLEEEKKLSIKDPLKKYFGTEEWFSRLPNGADLTLHMLLTHTSGIPEYVAKSDLWKAIQKSPDKIWTPVERLEYILGDKPQNPPGKGWSYADTNYIILGMVVEQITGNTYYHELQKRILNPLKLHQTTPADQRKLPSLVPGYSKLGSPFNISGNVILANGKYIFNPQLEWTGGGLITTAKELAIWAGRLYKGQVCSKESLKKMLLGVDSGEGFKYGLGVIIQKSEFGIIYGHTGFVPGYNSIMMYMPKYKFSIALQFNCDYVSQALKKNKDTITLEFIKIIINSLN